MTISRNSLLRFSIFCLAIIPFLACAETSTHWPQWRGPDGNGVFSGQSPPTEWSGTNNVLWKTPIEGRGHSSPIVWDKTIFLTTGLEMEVVPGAKAPVHMVDGNVFRHPESTGADKRQVLKVVCLDAPTGKILWESTAHDGTVYDDYHRKGAYASPTPTTDGEHVYAYFGAEGLFCYDFKGKLVWQTILGKLSTLGMGVGSSPVLWKDLVIVQCDQGTGNDSFIAGIRKSDGKELWRAARKIQVGWSTPVIVTAGGHAELVASGSELVIGYDPATGTELWHAKGLENNAVPSPVWNENGVFLSAGYPAKRVLAIKPGGTGDISDTPQISWTTNKGAAYVPSPIVYQDNLYLLSDKGMMSCLDSKTGKAKYEGGRLPVPASFTSSPVAFDGKIFVTSEAGETFIVKAGPEHEILGRNALGEPVFASPAIVDGRLYIRGATNLYCIGKKG